MPLHTAESCQLLSQSRSPWRSLRLLLAAGAALACGSMSLGQSTVQREGEGTRRAELNAMELQAFPADLLTKLSDWQNGAAPTPADWVGKPVLIFTWSDWYAPAKRAMTSAQKLSEKYSKDGLIVIGVHNPEGWADSAKPAAGAGSLLLAHDASGDFRKGLKVDQDPDFYLIDRAGQLRYADIKNESLDAAITEVLAEKTDDAAAIKDRLASDAKAKDAAARRTESLHADARFTQIPEQEFTPPTAEDFKTVKWPALPKDPNNPFAPIPTAKVAQIPAGEWFPSKPELKGRMVIVYFWSPVFNETFYEPMPFADQMQTQYGRDAVIIGVMSTFDNVNGVTLKDEDKDPAKLLKRMKAIAESRNLKHYLVADTGNAMLNSIADTTTGQTIFPFWAILSSDRTARWWSSPGSTSPWGAMQNVMENDPGIKARRAAEAEWLRKNN